MVVVSAQLTVPASLQFLVLVRESLYKKSSIFQNEPKAFRRKKWCREVLVSES